MPFRDEPIVTLATFETDFEASLARGALEAIGIRAMVPGELSGTYGRGHAAQFHRVEVKVFESDRDRAMVELRRMQIRVVDSPHDDCQ